MPIDGTEGVGTGKEGPKLEDGNLEAPVNVIASESAARVVYDRLMHSHAKRCWNYERIQGLLDGNPPYSPRAMQEAGLADMSNVNWKDGDAVYKSVALAYWSLFNDVENIAEFKVDFGEVFQAKPNGLLRAFHPCALFPIGGLNETTVLLLRTISLSSGSVMNVIHANGLIKRVSITNPSICVYA